MSEFPCDRGIFLHELIEGNMEPTHCETKFLRNEWIKLSRYAPTTVARRQQGRLWDGGDPLIGVCVVGGVLARILDSACDMFIKKADLQGL